MRLAPYTDRFSDPVVDDLIEVWVTLLGKSTLRQAFRAGGDPVFVLQFFPRKNLAAVFPPFFRKFEHLRDARAFRRRICQERTIIRRYFFDPETGQILG